ncbi:MAG: hypothetical protein H3Z53_09465 [archaeon]|nr:hypothetical protein [archaeon]MCP8314581.1 hypothetical protein [archaeon]
MDIESLVNAVKSYKGVKRKLIIGELARIISKDCKFEDAGWFQVDDKYVVITVDGIADWLLAYPSFGFIVTTDDKRVAKVLEIFGEKGYQAEITGEITPTTEVSIRYNGEKRTVFDIKKDKIFG